MRSGFRITRSKSRNRIRDSSPTAARPLPPNLHGRGKTGRIRRHRAETNSDSRWLPQGRLHRSAIPKCLRRLSQVRRPTESSTQYKQPPNINWDDEKYQGDAYGAFAWAIYIAEVAVDTRTYEVKLEDFVALQEVGKVIHPVLAAGQIEGGVAQGIGYALYEQVVWKDGRMANGQMTNYMMPTAATCRRFAFSSRNFLMHTARRAPKGLGSFRWTVRVPRS